MVDATLAGCGLCQLLTWLVGEHLRQGRLVTVRIPLMADSDSIPIADSVPCDGGHRARGS